MPDALKAPLTQFEERVTIANSKHTPQQAFNPVEKVTHCREESCVLLADFGAARTPRSQRRCFIRMGLFQFLRLLTLLLLQQNLFPEKKWVDLRVELSLLWIREEGARIILAAIRGVQVAE